MAISITDAIVLRQMDYGEADRITVLFTLAHGKLSAIAKGARRSRKRFGAALSLFGYGQATLRERRDQELWVLEDIHSEHGFSHLAYELGRFAQASYACELCSELCPPLVAEPAIFSLLLTLLSTLDQLPKDKKPRPEPLLSFELQLLQAVGLQLSLDRCISCGNTEIMEETKNHSILFDLQGGGVLCKTCSPKNQAPIGTFHFLPSEAYQALLTLEYTQLGSEESEHLRFSAPVLQACRTLLLAVFQHHLGKKLRTVEFISQVNEADLTK